MEPLNKLDKLILNRLQINGRAAYDQIANTVSLSPSAVLRRVMTRSSVHDCETRFVLDHVKATTALPL